MNERYKRREPAEVPDHKSCGQRDLPYVRGGHQQRKNLVYQRVGFLCLNWSIWLKAAAHPYFWLFSSVLIV